MARSSLGFYLRTVTGWLLILNAIVFVLVTVQGMSLFSPPETVLQAFGAKDPIAIALGQWWRLITPLFLHIGLIHFVLNNMALKIIGQQLEQLLGVGWFLCIYFAGGILGNIFSSFTHLSLGGGASGSLFALIGTGVVIEQFLFNEQRGGWRWGLRQLKERIGPYSILALVNIAIAVVINFILVLTDVAKIGIDNMAHVGGLVAGLWLGLAMFYLKRNRFTSRHLGSGLLMVLVFVTGMAYGTYKLCYTDTIRKMYDQAIATAEDDIHKYIYLSQAMQISPEDHRLFFERGVVLLDHKEFKNAVRDLRKAAEDPSLDLDFSLLVQRLRKERREAEAAFIASMRLGHH